MVFVSYHPKTIPLQLFISVLRSRVLFENEYIDTNRVKVWDFLWLLSDNVAHKAPHYLSAEITTHKEAPRNY